MPLRGWSKMNTTLYGKSVLYLHLTVWADQNKLPNYPMITSIVILWVWPAPEWSTPGCQSICIYVWEVGDWTATSDCDVSSRLFTLHYCTVATSDTAACVRRGAVLYQFSFHANWVLGGQTALWHIDFLRLRNILTYLLTYLQTQRTASWSDDPITQCLLPPNVGSEGTKITKMKRLHTCDGMEYSWSVPAVHGVIQQQSVTQIFQPDLLNGVVMSGTGPHTYTEWPYARPLHEVAFSKHSMVILYVLTSANSVWC